MDAWFSTLELVFVFDELELSVSESTALFIFAWDKIDSCDFPLAVAAWFESVVFVLFVVVPFVAVGLLLKKIN